MKKLIIWADIVGLPPTILIDDKTRHKSLFGGILSILSFISIIGIVLYFFFEFINKTQSSVIYNWEQSIIQGRNLTSFPYSIRIINSLGELISDSYAYIHSEVWKIKYLNVSGQSILNVTRNIIIHEKCDIKKNFGEYRFLFENATYLKDSYCPVLGVNDLSIKFPYGESLGYTFINHYIVKCTNDTSKNKSNCAPPDKISSALGNTFILFNFLEYSIDNNNVYSPGKINMRTEQTAISSSIFTRIWFYVRNIDYISDDGFVFENKQSYEYFKISQPKFTYNLLGGAIPNSYATVTITMDNIKDIYERKYMKAQNLLANVGGVIKGILTLSQLFSYYICNTLYEIDLTSSIFNLSFNTENNTALTLNPKNEK
jgi:hypothetical protein